MKKEIKIVSASAKETRDMGGAFAGQLERGLSKKSVTVVALRGDLGAGKTTFVLGFLKHFGIRPHAASPTFVIMKKYKGKLRMANGKSHEKFIYHLDAYRLRSAKDLKTLNFDEILGNPKNIVLVEWPERIKGARFKNKIGINFSYGQKENERIISFSE